MNKNLSKMLNPTILSAQHYDRKITVEIDHSDTDLSEVMEAVETLIIGMGFSKDALKHWVLDMYDVYRDEDDANVEPVYDGAGFTHSDNFPSHFVSNEEADEDYRASIVQDSQRYEDSLSVDVEKAERGLITQQLLDFVDSKGAATYSEMNEYYKRITGGSNSFSHILANLRIPYKNRKTQRYLAKEGKRYSDAKYIVKLANPSNWVVVDNYDDFKTFNEAPYGDN